MNFRTKGCDQGEKGEAHGEEDDGVDVLTLGRKKGGCQNVLSTSRKEFFVALIYFV